MPAVKFSQLIAEMEALYRPPHRRPATWAKLKKVLEEFASLKSVKRTSDITPLTITQWLEAHQDRKPVTNYSYLSSFRAACTYAKKRRFLHTSPWEFRSDWIALDDDEEDEPLDRHRSAEEISTLLRILDEDASQGGWKEARLHALIYTYAFLGLRKMEALQLKKVDVCLDDNTVQIRSRRRQKLKTRSSNAVLVMPVDLAVILSRWIPRTGSEWLFPGVTGKGPWTGGLPGSKPLDCVKAAGKRAGIENLTILDFRHTIGTLAEGWGMGELELMRWLRHSKPSTQSAYRKKADRAGLEATAAKISFKKTGT